MRAVGNRIFWSVLILLLTYTLHQVRFSMGDGFEDMVPVVEVGKVKMMMMAMVNESRRKLNSFEVCSPCTCCSTGKSYCLPTACCYSINCNIPNRPFGFCSFTPQTCNCLNCHI